MKNINIISAMLGLAASSYKHLLSTGGFRKTSQPVRMLWNSTRIGTYRRADHGELLINGKPRPEFQ